MSEQRTWHNGAINYVEHDGTFYHEQTPEKVIQVLNRFMSSASFFCTRLRLYYGDADSGKDWGERRESLIGYVGRSTGDVKIPILLYNTRSSGGALILDDCIVKIEYASKKCGGVLYQHPFYKGVSYG